MNHLLLIYKSFLYKNRDLQKLSFLDFKNDIIKIITLEERISKEIKFLNKWQIINTALSS